MAYVYSTLTPKGQGQSHAHFRCEFLANGDRRGNFFLPTKRKFHKAFRLAYLPLTLTHSKGQGQGQAHFPCEFLVNGDS